MRGMTDQKPSSALTKRSISARTLLAGAGIAALVTTGGIGAYAVTQQAQPAPVEQTAEPALAPLVPNIAPTAQFGVSGGDLTYTFDASASSDPDDGIVVYTWDFGDGLIGVGRVATHTFAAGTYTVTLNVLDAAGDSATFTAEVTATDPPPPPPAVVQPPASGGYTYGQYPPGATMPNIPGTDQPDTSACASSTGTADANGNPVCA